MNTKHSWHDPHIVRAGKSLLRALYFTLGAFLVFFVLSRIGGALYISYISAQSTKAFETGVARELNYLKEQGDVIARNETLIDSLLAGDSNSILAITKEEKDKRSIGLIGVANSKGTIVSRTMSRSSLGQNVFVTVPAGRIVSKGQSAQSIEMTGFGGQLFMTTARPIMREENMIGALFANRLMNDDYAQSFRDKYLPSGTEVVFYTNEFGVYGDSFSDLQIRSLIKSYFNSGSEWIQNQVSDKTISFDEKSFYLAKNIVFPGLEESPGGALLFIPRTDISGFVNLLTALLTLFIFIILALREHARSRGDERGWRYYAILGFASIPVGMLVLLLLYFQNLGYFRLERIPYPIYNSTIRLQPEFGIYDIDFEQRFSIIVDTGDEAINAVHIGLLFDPEAIEIKALETSGSTCSYVIENTIDASIGRADLACVILKSSGEQGSLSIADVVVMPKRRGTFTLSFDKAETKVLASDGLGTDVLRMSQSGSYQVDTFDPDLFTTTTTTLTSFVVFSSTHPNQSRWYKSPTARFLWRGKLGEVYAYAFDSLPDTIPSNTHTTQDSTIDLSIPGDGIFYFHLRAVSGGSTTHYRIQADKTSPSIVSIQLSENNVVAGDVVRFSFEAEDSGSGVQQNYYVDLGNHLFLPIGSQLFVPFLEAGSQKVVLRVYDAAGNYSEKTEIVEVKQKPQ